jgi:hypothetical protein
MELNQFDVTAEFRNRMELFLKANEDKTFFTTKTGLSLIEVVPTDTYVLLKGTCNQSTIELSEKRISENEVFTFNVVGFGYLVDDLELGMEVQSFNNQRKMIDVKSNERSVKNLQIWIRSMKASDIAELIKTTPSIEAIEYFLIPRYDICAITK